MLQSGGEVVSTLWGGGAPLKTHHKQREDTQTLITVTSATLNVNDRSPTRDIYNNSCFRSDLRSRMGVSFFWF